MRKMIYNPNGGAKTVSYDDLGDWLKKGWLEVGLTPKEITVEEFKPVSPPKKRGRPKKEDKKVKKEK